MKEIIQEKLNQAVALLNEQNIDCWLTFVRETSQVHDPALGLLLGFGLTWDSALIITRSGRKIAIVGRFDGDNVRALEAYDEVLTHDTGITQQLRKCLGALNPRNIALNYSLSDSGSDGLTFGMYARLTQMLAGTPYAANFTSAENVVRRLRERKTATELARIRRIVAITEQAYAELFASPLIGKSEIDIHALSGEVAARLGVGFGWERTNNPIVNAGPHSAVGHSIPGELIAQPGQLLHFDMGLRLDGYCSDLQRVAYIRREGETEAPADVMRAWDACWCALEAGKAALKAGVPGWQVDAAARAEIVRQGYPEYMHAVGHHVGQQAHDGGSLLGPRWEKYGNLPNMPVEAGNVFTLELGTHLSDYGFIGIEEMVLVTDTGADYISTPQRELVIL
jgi:Xaa-Pro dipeptidase